MNFADDVVMPAGNAGRELIATVIALAAAPWCTPHSLQRAISERLDTGLECGARAVASALVAGASARRPMPTQQQVRAAAAELVAAGARVVVVGHRGYPVRLAPAWPELGAPLWLFAHGPDPLPEGPAVAVVGTRQPSLDGLRTARELARLLARSGVAVVSGMARGIDQAAHRGALDAGGPTIAVLGTGFGVDYPHRTAELREQIAASGGILSELPPGAGPKPEHFLWRNRVIAGLADVTVVVEGRSRSGALHTARLAAAQGREVLAVPGSINAPTSRAPLDLIRDGAGTLTRLEDVFDVLDGLPAPDHNGAATMVVQGLDPVARQVLELLGATPAGVGDLAAATGRAVSSVLAAASDLVARGLAERTARGLVRSRH